MPILLIDDSLDDREAIARALASDGTLPARDVAATESAEEALALLRAGPFDCVLLDYNLPGHDGLAVLEEIQLRFPDLPVVMITGEGNEQVAVTALKNGAMDYLSKADLSGEAIARAVAGGIEAKRAQLELIQNAYKDPLTGLANRRAFEERLSQLVGRGERESTPFAVIFMDLDGFKPVNDLHGHQAGDLVLAEVARRLDDIMRGGDLLARLGGDEFGAIVENMDYRVPPKGHPVAHRLHCAVESLPFDFPGGSVALGVSIGLAFYPMMATTESALLRAADLSMYESKRARQRRRMSCEELGMHAS